MIELATTPSIAAGDGPAPGETLCRLLPGSELVRLYESAGREFTPQPGRHLVIVARDAHRHEWQRRAIESLLGAAPDTVVVEVGLPEWRPNGDVAFVATYGAARVNLEAAAEAIGS